MNSDLAKSALAFLGRAQLQGVEVPRFLEVCNSLEEIANGTVQEQPVGDAEQPEVTHLPRNPHHAR